MMTLEVCRVGLSKCTIGPGDRFVVRPGDLPTIQYVLEGQGWLVLDENAPIPLSPHTLAIIPPKSEFAVFQTQKVRAADINAFDREIDREPGSGEVRLVFASGEFQAVYGPGFDLFATLAMPIVERFDAHDQLDQIIGHPMTELAGTDFGSNPISAALLKLVLIALLRRSLVSSNAWAEGLAVLNDLQIARAFAEMSARPAARHTALSLSNVAGLGRSTFMARFAAVLGEAPISVLRRLRMRQAAALLATDALSVDQVAGRVGYRSRSSFTRGFRKSHGIDPSGYRARERRGSAGSCVRSEQRTPFASSDQSCLRTILPQRHAQERSGGAEAGAWARRPHGLLPTDLALRRL